MNLMKTGLFVAGLGATLVPALSHSLLKEKDLLPDALPTQEQIDLYNRQAGNLAAGRPSLGEVLAYEDLFSQDTVMAQLEIPALDLLLPVYPGTNEQTMYKGAGHMEGSSLPYGGIGTKTVLASHSGPTLSGLFARLDLLREGDVFRLHDGKEVREYRIRDIQVVSPDETSLLQPEAGKDLAVLLTCTPYGINSHRLVVTGERTDKTENEPSSAFPWEVLDWSLPALYCAGWALLARKGGNVR